MSDHLTVEVVDADGAIREALDDIEKGTSREGFLKKALTTGGVVALGGVAIGGLPALVTAAPGPAQDTKILNFALLLEYLEAEFYTLAAKSGALSGEAAQLARVVGAHERAHVAFLRKALGSAAVPKPTFDFTAGNGSGNGPFVGVFSNYEIYKAVSQAFEDTGVRAYKGQAPNLMSNDAILRAALQIHSVEARHASEVRRLRGLKGWITGIQTDIPGTEAVYDGEARLRQAGIFVPSVTRANEDRITEAFDEPLSMAQVLFIVAPFIVGSNP